MKKKNQNSIRKHFFTICFAIMLCNIFCIQASAQTPHIDFTYDAAGNRVMRGYAPMRLMSDTTINDEQAQQIAAQYGITVYPNPAGGGDIINVSISSANNKSAASPATISLLDNNGKTLYSQQQNIPSISQVDIKKYSSGVYYVKVTVSNPAKKDERLFYRIVKTK